VKTTLSCERERVHHRLGPTISEEKERKRAKRRTAKEEGKSKSISLPSECFSPLFCLIFLCARLGPCFQTLHVLLLIISLCYFGLERRKKNTQFTASKLDQRFSKRLIVVECRVALKPAQVSDRKSE
jgi:hypothetical protein